ncbi:MAG: hypothetical protein AB1792_07510 [Candidatus Zixiibacteriota bacterium]
MSQSTPADPIYRAAILAGGDLEKDTPPSRRDALRVLTAALERMGLTVQVTEERGICVIGGSDGILIGGVGEERATEAAALLREQHWSRAHVVTFTARALSIKTIAA